jgi:hypothetical protein
LVRYGGWFAGISVFREDINLTALVADNVIDLLSTGYDVDAVARPEAGCDCAITLCYSILDSLHNLLPGSRIGYFDFPQNGVTPKVCVIAHKALWLIHQAVNRIERKLVGSWRGRRNCCGI